jgi:hypothetical protein
MINRPPPNTLTSQDHLSAAAVLVAASGRNQALTSTESTIRPSASRGSGMVASDRRSRSTRIRP